jgi:hypothetical protein
MELFRAVVTFVGIVTTVNPHMNLQIPICCKQFVADRTRVITPVAVILPVVLFLPLNWKELFTRLAIKF